MIRVTALVMALLAGACASSAEPQPPTPAMPPGSPAGGSPLVDNAGKEIGRVHFTAAPKGALIRIVVKPGGLAPGWHGTHLHMVGDCSDTAKFAHAGGHIKTNETNHGLLYPHGPESGDLPNLSVMGDGSAAAEMFTNLVTLSELQDQDGSALMIHAGPDDHVTQPTGNSGDRVACAVVVP